MKEIKFELVPYTRGFGLDLSAGTTGKMFRHWISTAECPSLRWADLSPFQDRSLNFIFSAGVLENSTSQERLGYLKDWWRALKYEGSLCIVSDPALLPEDDLIAEMKRVGFWEMKVKRVVEGVYLHVYRKTQVRDHRFAYEMKIPEKTVCVIRYGAIGDCFVASSILPGLKEQGYHVVFNTQQTGQEMLSGNPYIDEFLLQDKNQLEDEDLGDWWVFLKERYGRILNLCETMEGAICALPGRSPYTWPDEVRRKYLGHNYYEFLHDLAGVPLPPRPGIFLTSEERKRAQKRRRDIGHEKFLLLWILSGSAVHKQVSQTDFVLGIPGQPGLLDQYPNLHVALVGDEFCRLLEGGWENHPQVTCASGKWSIRETLAMVEQADCVIGPETGMVNVAGMLGIPTVAFLSHTSEDTLCRYWKNYQVLKPENVPCFPCYKLHYGREACNVDEERRAACVAGISVQSVQNALSFYIERRERKAA